MVKKDISFYIEYHCSLWYHRAHNKMCILAKKVIMTPDIHFLEHVAYNIRVDALRMTTNAGSGHITSCLSAADIVAALFFHAMRFDLQNHENPNNDRFILSKGHASPLLYAVYEQLGKLTEKDLLGYRQFDSVLEGHPTPRFEYAEAATGSLGQGLSIASGITYAGRMNDYDYYTYCLLGDMETVEGSVWEAVEVAAYYKLNRLIAIIDCNRLGQSTSTMDEHKLNRYAQKFASFGWNVLMVDGHNMRELVFIFDEAKKEIARPTMIIAKTIKGYGISKAEDKQGFHGVAFKKEELQDLLQDLKNRFHAAATYKPEHPWHPQLPHDIKKTETQKKSIKAALPSYHLNEKIPTRKVYGESLVALGAAFENIVCLDAEVKNSTFAEIFEKKYPTRFIQCFIAEQNMIGMAVGLATRGKIPFASTFGAFFTRAFDQIRMAAIGRVPLRLVGSHAGVSIGQDGPSQMALEDLAMFSVIPQSVILYPCDAVSTAKLVQLMIDYHDGISYLRTTRPATAVIYDNNEQFTIGGCKVIKQSDHDVACIIAAGITVHEALSAYELLRQENIYVAIIDAYSIKPLADDVIERMAQKSKGNVVTVEDHYLEGGLGSRVSYALRNKNFFIKCLAVTKMPRSGTPQELMAYEKIDSSAISDTIKKIIS